jgi:hypothetical protein
MMKLGRHFLVGLVSTAVAVACGSDPKPTEPCRDGRPDFELLIKAQSGPLPEDLVVRVLFSGGEEEYVLASPGTQEVMFCKVADREGNVIDAGSPHVNGSAGAGGAGAEGEGGAGGAPGDREVEALRCEIWSFGSARIEVETAAYPMQEPLELFHKKDVCTVEAEFELAMPDAGMSR